jgi:hypothetical protein
MAFDLITRKQNTVAASRDTALSSSSMGWAWWDRIKSNIKKDDERRQADIARAFAPKPKAAPKTLSRAEYNVLVMTMAKATGPVNLQTLAIAKNIVDADLKRTNTTVMQGDAALAPASDTSNKALKAAAIIGIGGTALYFMGRGFLRSSSEEGNPWSPVR